jgi:Rnl2 family RNA ligase
MKFRAYPKMSSAAASTQGGPWVALEKVHGAHLVIGVAGDVVRVGKRKAWLDDADAFFGWQLLRAELVEQARGMARGLGGAVVCFYGELFGGGYPHPEVAPATGLVPVQTGVWYAPGLHWALFDVLVAANDDDEGELVAHRDVEALAASAGVMTPPVVGRGTRADLFRLPLRRPTAVPSLLGLPFIDGNVAEGLVLKADVRAAPTQRAVAKRKIPELSEGRFHESEAWDARQRLTLAELLPWASRLVDGARVASARSKLGEVALDALIEEIVLDVRVDLEEAFPAACAQLEPDEERRLDEHVIARARASLGVIPG